MATIVLTAVGASLGGAAFGGAASIAGAAIANLAANRVGNVFNKAKFSTSKGRINSIPIQNSSYGEPIKKIFGESRVAGNVIWIDKIKEHEHRSTQRHRGGKGGGKAKVTSVHYTYSVSFAVAVCEGEVNSILNIWADAELLNIGNYDIRIYSGDEKQIPDQLIESKMGKGKAPGYRGLCYVVFEGFPLTEYGNRIPNFSFHVSRQPKTNLDTVENLVKGMCIIPGSGEFVYDTKTQFLENSSRYNNQMIRHGKAKAINQNNYNQITDACLSSKQLDSVCPNLEWVAPVSSWFATSLDIGTCLIKPGVEDKFRSTFPDLWRVEDFNRSNAHQITKSSNSPIYGGSVSDQSLIRYLDHLKSEYSYKIMFYPMIFVDKLDKPWRGRMAGKAEDVYSFFNGKFGYNRFILHYANLVKGRVNAFLIGSELVNMTRIKDKEGNYPVVDELIKLAKQVKEILGDSVKISYAADWTEYHNYNGWHYLDKLWSSEFIDFIGIDAYFPLTSGAENKTTKEIAAGWRSGEHYNYKYISKLDGRKQPIPISKAIKNIEWWWSNYHFDPNFKKTEWVPKSKPVWFTEYGFPSVDCASNQPNLFYDNESSEGGLPHQSKGEVDFIAQRNAIEATEIALRDCEFIENKFLWTWDARPYPYWPKFKNIWSDAYKWSRGHWVNGKFGKVELKTLIAELCRRVGLGVDRLRFENIDILIEGYLIDERSSAEEVISELQEIFMFDIIENNGDLIFKIADEKKYELIDNNNILLGKDSVLVERAAKQDNYKSLKLIYIDKDNGFQPSVAQAFSDEFGSGAAQKTVSYKLVSNAGQAKILAEDLLNGFNRVKNRFKFNLSEYYQSLLPGDILKFQYLDHEVDIKIIETYLNKDYTISITGVDYQKNNSYRSYSHVAHGVLESQAEPILNYEILDVLMESEEPMVYVAIWSENQFFRPASIYFSNNNKDYYFYDSIHTESTVGYLVSELPKASNYGYLDLETKLLVSITSGELESISFEELNGGKNLAYVNGEIIQYVYAKLVSENLYELSYLLRGQNFTENQIKKHKSSSRFILIDGSLTKVSVPRGFDDNMFYSKLAASNYDLDKINARRHLLHLNSTKEPSVVNVKKKIIGNKCHLTWYQRVKRDYFWNDGFYSDSNQENKTLVRFYQAEELISEKIISNNKLVCDYNQDKPYLITIANLSLDGRIGETIRVKL